MKVIQDDPHKARYVENIYKCPAYYYGYYLMWHPLVFKPTRRI
jgi:hypothetical protein